MSTPATAQWTAKDDQRLRQHLEAGNGKVSWAELSRQAFPDGRFTKNDCMERWKAISKPKPLRGPWTKEEDAKLQDLVARHGSEKWVVIATEMVTRSGKQCRERWHNHLDPTINKGEWTKEEDEIIHKLYAKIGSRWAEMAKHLPGRPDNAIKNYWNASLIRQKRRRGTSISSLTGALDLSGDAPSMTRSSSSNSLSNSMSRYTPYARSSPMSKSRSESVSSPNAMSPYRRGSVEYPSPTFPSPYASPGMVRSQTYCGPSYSPTPGGHRMAPSPSLGVIARDLSKEMVDPSAGVPQPFAFPAAPGGARDTPPATPDRSPLLRRQTHSSPALPPTEYPFYPPPPSPPSSANTATPYSPHPTLSQSQNGWNDAGVVHSPYAPSGFDVNPFQQLQITDDHLHTYSPQPVPYVHDQFASPRPDISPVPYSPATSFYSPREEMPYIHPHHQLGGYELQLSHQSPQVGTGGLANIDEWGAPGPLMVEPGRLVVDESSHIYGSSPRDLTYDAPSYEEIAAATAHESKTTFNPYPDWSAHELKPDLRRQESQISSSSGNSAVFSVNSSPYTPSTHDMSPRPPALSQAPPPTGFDHRAIVPEAHSPALGSGAMQRMGSLPNPSSHRPTRLSGLAAPINLSPAPLSPVFDLERSQSHSLASRSKSEQNSPVADSFPLQNKRGLEGSLRIRTDGTRSAGVSPANSSPRSASAISSSNTHNPRLNSPSWNVKLHPTSDLMTIDNNGRATLPM